MVTQEVEELWLRRFLARHGDDPDLQELVARRREEILRRRLAWSSLVLTAVGFMAFLL